MKLRNRRLIAAAGWLGTQFTRGLFRSLRFQFQGFRSQSLASPLANDGSPFGANAGRVQCSAWAFPEAA